MIIACPACSTKFNVDATKLSATGTRVRCANCGHLWLQTPDGPLSAPTATPPAPKPASSPPPPPEAPPERAEPEPPRATPQRLVEPKPVPKPSPPFGGEPQEVEAEAVPPPAARGAPPPPAPRAPQGAPPGFKTSGRKPEGDRFSAQSTPPAAVPAESLKPERAKARPLREATRAPEVPAADRTPKRRGAGAFLTLVLAILILILSASGAAYLFREKIVKVWPNAAWAYEKAGIKVDIIHISYHNVTHTRLYEDGVPILEVRGELHNDSNDTVVIPRLRAGLRDEHKQELYHWIFTADVPRLGPHQITTFSSRLPSPPIEARDLEVRFVYGNE